MKYKIAIFLITALFMGAIGYSQDMEEMCIQKHMEMPHHEIENLKPEQKAQIEDIHMETRKTIAPIRAQVEVKEIELEKEMKSEKPDKDKIMKIAREIHELHWQIKKAHLEEQLKINSILTPEQREQMRLHRRKMIRKMEIERRIDD